MNDRIFALWRHLLPALGAGVSILLVALVTRQFAGGVAAVLLVASMGAAGVLLFCLPDSPLSTPRAFVGGHLVCVLTGITCAQWVPDLAVASALAVGGSIFFMRLLNCLHPPGGAAALTCVVGGPEIVEAGYQFLVAPVGINVLLMLSLSLLYRRVTCPPPGFDTREGV